MADKAKSVLVLIGVADQLADAIAQDHDVAIAASRPPFLGKRSDFPGDDAAWSAHCAEQFAEANNGEAAVIAEAFRALMAAPKSVLVVAAIDAFGATDDKGKRTAYPTVAAPDAWRQFGSLARSAGARIMWA